MIAVVNVDPNQRRTGEHLYEVRLNSRRLAEFRHAREDGLAACLRRAADAVDATCRKDADGRLIAEGETLERWLRLALAEAGDAAAKHGKAY